MHLYELCNLEQGRNYTTAGAGKRNSFISFRIVPIPPINKLQVMIGSRCMACLKAAKDILLTKGTFSRLHSLRQNLLESFFDFANNALVIVSRGMNNDI